MGVAFLAVSCIQLQSLQFRSHHCVLLAHSSTKIPARNYCVKTHWKGSLSAACLLGVPLECFCGPQSLLYLHSACLSNARVCTAWVEGVLPVSNMYIAWTSRLSECIIPQCVLVDTSLASRSCCALVSELPFVNSDQILPRHCHVVVWDTTVQKMFLGLCQCWIAFGCLAEIKQWRTSPLFYCKLLALLRNEVPGVVPVLMLFWLKSFVRVKSRIIMAVLSWGW